MVQQYKITFVEKLADKFKKAKHFIIAEYQGLNVEQISQLRKKLYEVNSEFKVIKNRMAKLAYKKLSLDFNDDWFKGPIGMVMCQKDDFVKTVNIIYKFSKDNEKLKIKVAFIENKVFNLEEIKVLANLPSREELIAKLLYLFNSPVSRFVYVLKNIVSKPVLVLKAIESKKAK
ncbi:MAG: 50S ribosomal protein L10 [bacterium]|nr:50S ribosomal protein L10 [bacterium]